MTQNPALHRTIRRTLMAVLAAVVVVAPLAACSANQSESSIGVAPATSGFDGAVDMAQLETGSSESARAQLDASASVIRSGDISIETPDPATAAEEVAEIASGLGGSVESQTVSEASEWSPATATLMLRIPADRFDDAFEALDGVGEVRSQNQSSADVTLQHVDLHARVEALQASVDRLTELMSGAATTSELIEAESALSQRQQELDGLSAQLDSLENQVAYSSIWVTLGAKSALPGGPKNFWEGLVAGVESIIAAGAGGLVLLGILLPWVIALGVIAWIVVLIVRGARRRGRRRRASAEAQAEERASEQPAAQAE